MSIFPDNNAAFAAPLLILYSRFSFLILSSIVMISFYISFKRLCLKHKGLSDARVGPLTKKEDSFAVHPLQRFIVFKVNI